VRSSYHAGKQFQRAIAPEATETAGV
jgi:hypothetical protein